MRVGHHSRLGGNLPYEKVISVVANDWHPSYDLSGNLENDVAVLTLSEDIEFVDGYVFLSYYTQLCATFLF